MQGRVLGIDFGQRRIGLALSDPTRLICSVYDQLERTSDRDVRWIEKLKNIVEEEEVVEIVMGLPLHMNGDEGEEARFVRETGSMLEKTLSRPVSYVDERLSTVSAERTLLEAGLSRTKRKGVRDSMAAQVILQSFLDRLRSGDAPE